MLALLGVLIGAFLQFLWGRQLDIKKQRALLRDDAYSKYLEAVAAVAAGTSQGLAELRAAKARIGIFGSARVLHALARFELAGASLQQESSIAAFLAGLMAMRTTSHAQDHVGDSKDLRIILLGPGQSRT